MKHLPVVYQPRTIQSKIRPLFVFLAPISKSGFYRLAVAPGSTSPGGPFSPHPPPLPPSPSFQYRTYASATTRPVVPAPGRMTCPPPRQKSTYDVAHATALCRNPPPPTASSTGFFCFGAPPTVFFPAEGCTPGRDSQTSRTVVRESA